MKSLMIENFIWTSEHKYLCICHNLKVQHIREEKKKKKYWSNLQTEEFMKGKLFSLQPTPQLFRAK